MNKEELGRDQKKEKIDGYVESQRERERGGGGGRTERKTDKQTQTYAHATY